MSLQNIPRIIFLVTFRTFTTHKNILYGQQKMMNKILAPTKKQRKHKFVEAPLISNNVPKSLSNDGPKSVNERRMKVLNKLFMEHISDLMSTGAHSTELTGYGIELTRVKIAPDFKTVKVYWLTRLDNLTEGIESLLKQNVSYLRHELSQLRVMGVVPKIEFVKDIQFSLLKVLDDKLSEADYGEDFIPTKPTYKLKSTMEIEMKLDEKIRKQIHDTEKHIGPLEDFQDLPEMPQNVLGLNHAAIMSRVVKSLHKSRALHRTKSKENEGDNMYAVDINDSPIKYSSRKEQKLALKEFLAKRNHTISSARKQQITIEEERVFDEEVWQQMEEDKLSEMEFRHFLRDLDEQDVFNEEVLEEQ